MTEYRTVHELRETAQIMLNVIGVVDATVIEQDPRHDRNVLEVTIDETYVRVPPRVLLALTERDYGIVPEPSRDGSIVIVAF